MNKLSLPSFDKEIPLTMLEGGRLSRRMKKVPESAPHIVELVKQITHKINPMVDWEHNPESKKYSADHVYNALVEAFATAKAKGGISDENYEDVIKTLDDIRAEWAEEREHQTVDPNYKQPHGFGSGLNRTEYFTEKEQLAGFPTYWLTAGLVGSSARLAPDAGVAGHLKKLPPKNESIEDLALEVPDCVDLTWSDIQERENRLNEEYYDFSQNGHDTKTLTDVADALGKPSVDEEIISAAMEILYPIYRQNITDDLELTEEQYQKFMSMLSSGGRVGRRSSMRPPLR